MPPRVLGEKLHSEGAEGEQPGGYLPSGDAWSPQAGRNLCHATSVEDSLRSALLTGGSWSKGTAKGEKCVQVAEQEGR